MAELALSAFERSRWPAIVGYYLAGVLAAAQLGKMSALAPLIAADLGLSLTTVAVVVSLIEIGGATLGVVAGLLASRLGLVRSLFIGMVCLCAAGVGGGFAQGGAALLAWRVVEAAGYLGVVVTAPVLVARVAPPASLGAAMTLWSTFVPVGIAVGAWGFAGAAAATHWRVALFCGAGIAVVVMIVCAWMHRRAGHIDGAPQPQAAWRPAEGRAPMRVSAATWQLSASFGCYALFEVGTLALLPLYLTSQAGASVAEAGRWAALAALATIAGSAAAALWMRHDGSPRGLIGVSLLVPALLLFGVFVDAPPPAHAAWLAVVLNAVSGAYPAFAFARLPSAAGSAAHLVRANGVFTQFGASGSLLGPPVMAWFVDRFGWSAVAWCGLAVTIPAILLVWRRVKAL